MVQGEGGTPAHWYWSLIPGPFLARRGWGNPLVLGTLSPLTLAPPTGPRQLIPSPLDRTRTRASPHSPDRCTSSYQQDMPQTGYGAGGTPLAFTQENFLVILSFVFALIYEGNARLGSAVFSFKYKNMYVILSICVQRLYCPSDCAPR